MKRKEKGKTLMKSAKESLMSHLPWIITTLLTIGAYGATIKYQGDSIAINEKSITAEREKVANMEKTIVRLETMQYDIKEMKEDIKDIKKIVLRPIIATVDSEKLDKSEKIVSIR